MASRAMAATMGAARAAEEKASSMRKASLILLAICWSNSLMITRTFGFIRRASRATSRLAISSFVAMIIERECGTPASMRA